MMIDTVQVGVMTAGVIPPGSFIDYTTVTAVIFGGKAVTTMIRKRITSSSWKKNTNIDLR